MAEEKKKPEEEEQKKSEAPPEKKPEEVPKDDKSEENVPASDDEQADESGEGADEKPEPENPPEKEEPKQEEPPENVPDPKDEEILRLKTQIAAMNLGVKAECVEDAVAVAESYVKSGKAKDVQSALSEVVKKYPDMKGDSKSTGFKVGADGSKDDNKQDDSKLSQAFGIRKKK